MTPLGKQVIILAAQVRGLRHRVANVGGQECPPHTARGKALRVLKKTGEPSSPAQMRRLVLRGWWWKTWELRG